MSGWSHEANERLWMAYVRAHKLRGSSQHTILNYYKSINRLDKQIKFVEASRIDLEEFFTAELGRVAVSTVGNFYAGLRAFYRWLLAEQYISTNPMEKVRVPEPEAGEIRILDEKQLKTLIAACKGKTFIDRRDEAIIRVMAEPGGPRLGEMHTMNLDAVDWRNQIIHIKGKTGVRLLPYGTKTADALDRYLRMRDSHKHHEHDGLWLCSRGQLGYYSFRAMLVRRCRAAGMQAIHPHLLRHSAADRAMAADISDIDMMTLFGWKSTKMLEVYARSNRTARAIASARKKALGDAL